MAGAGQGHVEQAHVFAEALVVGLLVGPRSLLLAPRQLDDPPCSAILVETRRRAAVAVQLPPAADEGQQHQGVFQPLGLVDGHHLDQVGVAFQAEDLFAPRTLHLLGQMADQRVLTVQLHRRALQPLGQVQQVGQAALAIGMPQQARRQFEVGEQAPQHRQYALGLPGPAIVAEAQDHPFPEQFVLVQSFQGRPVQVQAAGSQGDPQQRIGTGVGAGAQPVQQVDGLLAVEHRVAVGQVDAGQTPRRQRATDRLGLGATADEDGDIRRAQRTPAALLVGEAGAAQVGQAQPAADGAGAALGHFLAIRRGAKHAGFDIKVPERHRWRLGTVDQQTFGAPLGVHRMERHRVFQPLAGETEGAARVLFGEGEAAVGGRHHGGSRAEVLARV